MVPAYTLTVDITTPNPLIDEEEFRQQISYSLSCLDALKGAFGNKSSLACHLRNNRNENQKSKGFSLRCELVIHVGKDRAKYLIQLYCAIVDLIVFELPDFEVQAEWDQLNFS